MLKCVPFETLNPSEWLQFHVLDLNHSVRVDMMNNHRYWIKNKHFLYLFNTVKPLCFVVFHLISEIFFRNILHHVEYSNCFWSFIIHHSKHVIVLYTHNKVTSASTTTQHYSWTVDIPNSFPNIFKVDKWTFVTL